MTEVKTLRIERNYDQAKIKIEIRIYDEGIT